MLINSLPIPLEYQKNFQRIIGKNEKDKKNNLEIFFPNSPLYIFIKKVVTNNINSNAIPSFLISVRDTKKQNVIRK